MRAQKAQYPVATLARVLKVSRSGFHAWLAREPSAREKQDFELTKLIRTEHLESNGTYGVPRIHRALLRREHRVGKKRVARLMRRAGLVGVSRRRAARTTIRRAGDRPHADLVPREFKANAPNKLWVADITYVPTRAGLLYLL